MERKGRENLDFITWIKIQFTSFNAKSTLIWPNYRTLFPPNGVWEWERETLIEELLKPQLKEPLKYSENRLISRKSAWRTAVQGCTAVRHARSTARPCHLSGPAARSCLPHARSCVFSFASVCSPGASFNLYYPFNSLWKLYLFSKREGSPWKHR